MISLHYTNPTLYTQGNILDFDFDPFNTQRVVCALEDGTVKVWEVPEGGLVEQVRLHFFFFVSNLRLDVR